VIVPVVVASIEFWFNRMSVSEDSQFQNTLLAVVPSILYLMFNAFFQNFVLTPFPDW